MSRPVTPGGRKTRLNLAISPQVKARLDDIQQLTGADSMTEVIRRALAVYERIVEMDKDGCKLRVEDPNGKVLDRLRIWPT